MNASCCIIAITRAFKKYPLHSVSGDSVFIESDSVHSAHVTAAPFLSLIPPFLLRSCIFPLRFCDPRWLHLYKESKSGRTSLSASTKSCPDHRPPFAPESGSICPLSYAYRMQRVGSLPIPLGWAEGRSSKNERAAS